MKQPNYLIFGVAWIAAAVISIMNFVQYLDDRGNLVRGGLFLAMGVYYLWLNRKNRRKKK